jgi:hypothetical protein
LESRAEVTRRLKAARILADLEVTAIAEKLGWKTDKVYRHERGQIPDAVEIAAWANATGVSVEWLLGDGHSKGERGQAGNSPKGQAA